MAWLCMELGSLAASLFYLDDFSVSRWWCMVWSSLERWDHSHAPKWLVCAGPQKLRHVGSLPRLKSTWKFNSLKQNHLVNQTSIEKISDGIQGTIDGVAQCHSNLGPAIIGTMFWLWPSPELYAAAASGWCHGASWYGRPKWSQ